MDQDSRPQITSIRSVKFFGLLVVFLGLGFLLIIVRWADLQSSITIPPDTSALVRVFVEHPLAIGVLRGLALLAAILLLLALGVILYKVYAATELKTSIFEIKSRADEIVQIAAAREQEIETLKHQIEKLKFELLIRDMAEASKKRKGGS